MFRAILALSAVLSALLAQTPPAAAEDDMIARLRGLYGSDNSPEFSCADNPVTLDFTAAPPHAVFSWDFPSDTVVGPDRLREVYDLVGPTAGGLLMRLEGEPRRTDSGERPVWILRPAPDFSGFCWGRTDWPLMRCVGGHHRCEAVPPVS